ncbi:MAG: hypothetical protein M5U28_16510 [Sandaracinaceae bacterium]|nr:hypothetical protein [Sandaracinaceae bacterium]
MRDLARRGIAGVLGAVDEVVGFYGRAFRATRRGALLDSVTRVVVVALRVIELVHDLIGRFVASVLRARHAVVERRRGPLGAEAVDAALDAVAERSVVALDVIGARGWRPTVVARRAVAQAAVRAGIGPTIDARLAPAPDRPRRDHQPKNAPYECASAPPAGTMLPRLGES